ncbi:molybdopterin synthase catalytic subunit MoaE [Psychromonas sp. MB-3u-54]|uniref:molybdopterin synthase catalytic subunit MoaE n=1 Tax=Psychromonas sp. MB-3u-54 TaxID=2058319 RepID=UPI000C3221B0|nr:molybdopterin synthase catalytic subunit MoaE [Psychromonas sp. MB-3u-54]PKH04372.1 molybdopterin synthase catalytic subunit MoaE [Psychromonas sp. MB-3u-54]
MIRVQTEDFNQQREYDCLREQSSVGAVVTFTGLVRDMNQGEQVAGLTLEHYPGMTEKSLAQIVLQAKQRWNILACTLIHRVGELTLSEQIVFVGIATAHRKDAFAACEYIMDYLKTQAPFWKKECNSQGISYWVDARESDNSALDKWS